MLRVLAHAALADAVLHGGERLAFHGYRLEGRRLTAAGAGHAEQEPEVAEADDRGEKVTRAA